VSDVEHFPGGVAEEADSASSWALGALVVLVVIAPWPFGSVRPWTTELLTVTALVAALVALLGGLSRGASLPDVPLWPLVGFLGLGLAQLVPLPAGLHSLVAPASAAVWYPAEGAAAAVLGAGARPISLDPGTTARATALLGGLGLLGLVAAPALRQPRQALAASASVVLGGTLLATYAIFARARFGALLYGSIPVPTIKPFGPFVSKNHFAGYVVLVVLVALGLAVSLADRHRHRGRRDGATPAAVAVVVASVAMALAVLVSLSRGGVLSLLFGVTAFVVIRWSLLHRMDRSLLPPLVLGAILAGLLAAALPREAHLRMQTLDQASSFRLDTWRGALRMAAASPLAGQGLGAFHDAFPRYKRGHALTRVEHAENDYLETLGEGGLVGLGFALAGLVTLVAGGWRGLRRGGHPIVRGLGTGALAALFALAVHSSFDFNLRIPSNAALAALVAAMVAAASGLRDARSPRAVFAGLAVAAALLLALVLRVPPDGAAPARAEVSGAAGAESPEVRALRLARADRALVRTLGQRPAHAESWLLLAAVRADQGDRGGAAALARHAASLDPERKDLQAAAEKLGAVDGRTPVP
jgi:O-antigen ligase